MTLNPLEAELRLLTVRTVARLSGFSQKTVLRAIRAGELTASKIRGEYRVWPTDYRAWINADRVESPRRPVALPGRGLSEVGSAARLREMEPDA